MVKVMEHEDVYKFWKEIAENINNESASEDEENLQEKNVNSDLDGSSTDEIIVTTSNTDRPSVVNSRNHEITKLARYYNSTHFCANGGCSTNSTQNLSAASHHNINVSSIPINDNCPQSSDPVTYAQETETVDEVDGIINQPESPTTVNQITDNNQHALDNLNVASTSSTGKKTKRFPSKMYVSGKRKHQMLELQDENTEPPDYGLKITVYELDKNQRKRLKPKASCSIFGKKDSNEDRIYRKSLRLMKNIYNSMKNHPKSKNIVMSHRFNISEDDMTDEE